MVHLKIVQPSCFLLILFTGRTVMTGNFYAYLRKLQRFAVVGYKIRQNPTRLRRGHRFVSDSSLSSNWACMLKQQKQRSRRKQLEMIFLCYMLTNQ